MNVLCVGNSFAVDAATYVHQIAKAMGLDINIHVLYIPGCPVNLHYKNFLSSDKAYEFYVNGEMKPTMYCDIFEGLKYKKYDYITFQQRSGDSGDAETFFPELPLLMEGIRKYSDAKYLLHKTWSYAKSFSHEKYGSLPMDQKAMDEDIENAYLEVSERTGIKGIIPSGEAIRLARIKYGDNLTRDGYHLNELGRSLAGILWVFYLSRKIDHELNDFHPSGYTYDNGAAPIIERTIKELTFIAEEALKNNKGHNLN